MKKYINLINHLSKALVGNYKKIINEKDNELQKIYIEQKDKQNILVDQISAILSKNTTTVTISGKITDYETKKPISNVAISITDRFGSGFSFDVNTDSTGKYFCQIPKEVNKGRALIKINHSGYRPIDFNAASDIDRTLNFELINSISDATISGMITDKTSKKPIPDVVLKISDRFGNGFSYTCSC